MILLLHIFYVYEHTHTSAYKHALASSRVCMHACMCVFVRVKYIRTYANVPNYSKNVYFACTLPHTRVCVRLTMWVSLCFEGGDIEAKSLSKMIKEIASPTHLCNTHTHTQREGCIFDNINKCTYLVM